MPLKSFSRLGSTRNHINNRFIFSSPLQPLDLGQFLSISKNKCRFLNFRIQKSEIRNLLKKHAVFGSSQDRLALTHYPSYISDSFSFGAIYSGLGSSEHELIHSRLKSIQFGPYFSLLIPL